MSKEKGKIDLSPLIDQQTLDVLYQWAAMTGRFSADDVIRDAFEAYGWILEQQLKDRVIWATLSKPTDNEFLANYVLPEYKRNRKMTS